MSQDGVQSPPERNATMVVASDFIAGLVGGSAGLVVGHPFDTIKVQQQIAACNHVPSLQICSRAIIKEEGMRGFFRGMGFPLMAVGALNMIFFGIYGNTMRFMNGLHKRPPKQAPMLEVFLAGGIAGGVQGVFATPIELIKCKLQAQRQQQFMARKLGNQAIALYLGPVHCLKCIYKIEGFNGCFRGMNATILREVPGFSTYIMAYEWMNIKLSPDGESAPPIRAMLMSGGLAGVLSWTVNIPVDVIKSRLQTASHYKGFVDCVTHSYREEGLIVFFRGLPVTYLRAFPVNAVTLTVYSLVLRFMQEHIPGTFHAGT